jgi:hypothetical protein
MAEQEAGAEGTEDWPLISGQSTEGEKTEEIKEPVGDDKPAEPVVIDGAPEWLGGPVYDKEVAELAARYDGPIELAKAGVEARKIIAQGVPKLADDPTEEQLGEYRKAMGIPFEATGYELKPNVGTVPDENFVATMQNTFHRANLTPRQAAVLNEDWNKLEEGAEAATKKMDDDFAADTDKKLRERWGVNYDNYKAAAIQFANNEEIWGEFMEEAKSIELANGRFLMDHPVMLFAMSRAGRRIIADPLRTGMNEKQVGSLEGELEDLMKLAEGPDAQTKYWGDQKVLDRVAEINEVLHGTEPIVGEDQRRV